MSFVLGVVSNVWSTLLQEGSLTEQCRRAATLGFGYVELRQRALGQCEESVDGDVRPWPVPSALARLTSEVPQLRFNLAVEVPFLTEMVRPDDPYLLRCAEAALVLRGTPPVLRLVDVSPAPALLDGEEALEAFGSNVAGIAMELWKSGVALVLENSRQPVSALRRVIRRAVVRLPDEVPIPRICWDPHNQIVQTFIPEEPRETALALNMDELFEFHFKQSRQGELLPDVTDGDINWHGILEALQERGYDGPALFEIPGGSDIWQRLERSTAYIQGVLARVQRG